MNVNIKKIIFVSAIALLLCSCGSVNTKNLVVTNVKIDHSLPIKVIPFSGVYATAMATDTMLKELQNKGKFSKVSLGTQNNYSGTDAQNYYELIGTIVEVEQGAPAFPIARPSRASIQVGLKVKATGEMIWAKSYAKESDGRGLLAPKVEATINELIAQISTEISSL